MNHTQPSTGVPTNMKTAHGNPSLDAKSAGLVELDDLARFEGEGGPEALTPAPARPLVDVPLKNAVRRQLLPTATHESNKANPEP